MVIGNKVALLLLLSNNSTIQVYFSFVAVEILTFRDSKTRMKRRWDHFRKQKAALAVMNEMSTLAEAAIKFGLPINVIKSQIKRIRVIIFKIILSMCAAKNTTYLCCML